MMDQAKPLVGRSLGLALGSLACGAAASGWLPSQLFWSIGAAAAALIALGLAATFGRLLFEPIGASTVRPGQPWTILWPFLLLVLPLCLAFTAAVNGFVLWIGFAHIRGLPSALGIALAAAAALLGAVSFRDRRSLLIALAGGLTGLLVLSCRLMIGRWGG